MRSCAGRVCTASSTGPASEMSSTAHGSSTHPTGSAAISPGAGPSIATTARTNCSRFSSAPASCRSCVMEPTSSGASSRYPPCWHPIDWSGYSHRHCVRTDASLPERISSSPPGGCEPSPDPGQRYQYLLVTGSDGHGDHAQQVADADLPVCIEIEGRTQRIPAAFSQQPLQHELPQRLSQVDVP